MADRTETAAIGRSATSAAEDDFINRKFCLIIGLIAYKKSAFRGERAFLAIFFFPHPARMRRGRIEAN